MSILLFNRSHSFDYANWLADVDDELILFSDRVIRDMSKYRAVDIFSNFDNAGLAELRALDLARHSPFAAIIAHSEYDLLRAAQVREALSLPGQSVACANAYRNKFLMKELAAAAGIAIAPQRLLTSPVDLQQFVEQHGFSVVVKPVDGGGSRGIEVLHDRAQLHSFAKAWPARPYMVESFVDGQLYHIDGVARNGEIVFATASQYMSAGCLNFKDNLIGGSFLLDPQSQTHRDLLAFAQRVIQALPRSPDLGFHAEAFLTHQGDIVLCEIASRTGGGWVVDTIELAYGINLNREWTRLSAGVDDSVRLAACQPKRAAGWLLVPPANKPSSRTPLHPPFAWCRSVVNDVTKYVDGSPASGSIEFASMMLIEGASALETEARLRELSAWLGETCD